MFKYKIEYCFFDSQQTFENDYFYNEIKDFNYEFCKKYNIQDCTYVISIKIYKDV
jgi:hypothetical protein